MTIPEARKFVGRSLGFPETYDGSMLATNNLPVDQKQALTSGLLDYILNNPGLFTAQQVGVAQSQRGHIGTLGQVDTSFDYGQFFTELGDNAVDIIGTPLQNIGEGVSNTVAFIGKALPYIVIGGAIIYFWPWIARAVNSHKAPFVK